MGFSALVLVRPDPVSHDRSVGRVTAAASAEPLWRVREQLDAGPGPAPKAAFTVALGSDPGVWASALRAAGYRHAQVLRVPITGEHCYEFVALSTSEFVSDAAGHAVVYGLMESWPLWAEAVRLEVCPLTIKEVQAIKAVAAGCNGSEAAASLEISERTFRMHIDNAKRKLRSSSASEAAYKAHLMCAF